jgi:hypothetical protein
MLNALYDQGIFPASDRQDVSGAVSGAFIASSPRTVPTAREVASIWRGLRRGEIFPLNPRTGFFGSHGIA